MAEYGKLLSRIWSDADFTSLDARAQQVYCMLISYPTRNLAGVLPLTLKRWSKCTRDANVEVITNALRQLTSRAFVVVDWDTEEVLIRTYIRNDEVYRQPNLMEAARKFCRQVESAVLRWTLFDELTRLPEHKNSEKTEETAKALIEGLERTPSEGFSDGLPEPPGVGGYLSTVGEHQHPYPSPAPAPAPEAPRGPAINPTAAKLVSQIIPVAHPEPVKWALRNKASEMMLAGTEPEIIEAALHLWNEKPDAGPGLLPSLVSQVIKSRDRPANVTTFQRKTAQNAVVFDSLGDLPDTPELLA